MTFLLGTGELFFLRSTRISNRIGRPIRFRIESAVYTTQAVTPSNELQGAPCRRTAYAYMLTTGVMNVCNCVLCCVNVLLCLYFVEC